MILVSSQPIIEHREWKLSQLQGMILSDLSILSTKLVEMPSYMLDWSVEARVDLIAVGVRNMNFSSMLV